MEVVSPINGSGKISLIDEFEVAKIITLYKKIGIDINRFFTDLEKISLYQCNESLYRFYYPFSVFGDNQFYQELYSKISDYYYPKRWEYNYSSSQITSGSSVLEIGCGSGVFLEKIKSNNIVTGLELNSKAVLDCKKKGLTVHEELIESFSKKNMNSFDVVCSFQVLEHVEDVKSFIDSALLTLKPGGKLIVSVPNSNPFFLRHDKYHTLNLPPHHSGLWNRESLTNLTDFFPMKLVNIKAEPLKEYKEWYQVQLNYYKSQKPLLAFLMKIIPRPVYKTTIRLFSEFIDGAYITAIYIKK